MITYRYIFSFVILATLLRSPIWADNKAASVLLADGQAVSVGAEQKLLASELPEISAKIYAVKDVQSGQILMQHGLNDKIQPASFTKLMTAYVVFKKLQEHTITPEQKITVSEQAWRASGSRMFLMKGSNVAVNDLLRGLAIVSANDAAIALAEVVSGSEEQFVKLMNQEAKRLGMHHTQFVNSTGEQSNQQFSNAEDLLILTEALMRDFPKEYALFSEKTLSYNGMVQQNKNLLLYRDSSVDGLQTSYDNVEDYGLLATSKRNKRRVAALVIGTNSEEERAVEANKLLQYALQQFDTIQLYHANQPILQLKIYQGDRDAINLGFLNDRFLTLPHQDKLNIKPILETKQPLLAPIQKGQKLGVLKINDNGKTIMQFDVVALETVNQAGFWHNLGDNLLLWCRKLFGG